ncbi:MAG TPA: ATP-binding protein [Chloroflexota bacterium]|nr:ATP-binding protein [Chloroflexota bacterium]
MNTELPSATQAELQRRVRELSFLERIVRVSASTLDQTTLLRSIIDETTAATGTQVCSLYLWDESEDVFALTATNGLAQWGVGQVKLGLGEGITGWVGAQRQPLWVRDVRKEPRFTWVPNLDQEQFVSMLSVPIISRDRVVGVMNIQTTEAHDFSTEEIDFVSAIAGQIAGIIELSRLHDRVARQLELEKAAVASLTALNAGKSDLLSMLSHDFRGPLSIAKSYVHGLMGRLEGEERAACEEIDSELKTLENMVDNLMLSLQLEAQHTLVLDIEEFDLTDLVQTQARRLNRTSATHDIKVDASDVCRVSADRSKVQAVLMNLLGNAIKYSPAGGEILVRVHRQSGMVEISVTDHGIGIDERETATLFERYGRGDKALQQGINGHGLGLFICKQIVEAHGGLIYARRVPGGSCFAFTLPIAGSKSNGHR